MLPTLAPGEWWIAVRTARIRPGDLVVVAVPGRPGLLAVKRAVRLEGDRWWVLGDNPAASTDSRAYGPVPPDAVIARLAWRYRPLPPRRAR